MPLWGRPPGAKGSKQRRRWEREQALWAEQVRIEEIDSEEMDSHMVDYGKRRFVSDPLHFTGIDMSPNPQVRRSYAFEGSDSSLSTSSNSNSDSGYDDSEGAQQLALRNKEEALVQSALARIRRAQEKGKLEVKLLEEEVKALERRRMRLQSAAASAATTSKKKKGSPSGGSERRKRKDRNMVTVPIVQPDSKVRSKKRREETPPATGGPGMRIEGVDGSISYVPIGYASSSSTRSSPSRPRSSSSMQYNMRQNGPSANQAYNTGMRHVSEGTRPTSSGINRRPLPDEQAWLPTTSRRSSNGPK